MLTKETHTSDEVRLVDEGSSDLIVGVAGLALAEIDFDTSRVLLQLGRTETAQAKGQCESSSKRE